MVNFYSITYDANDSTAGITPVMQAAESNNDTYYFALSEGLDLKKSGYSFIGWAEDSQAVDPQYVAGSTIALTIDKPAKTLYAVWRIDKAWNNITKMQELTPNTCRGLNLNTSKQLEDNRDNKSYWVTKLADGNCWMTQNLDYDVKTTDIANVIKFDNKTGLAEWPNKNDGIARYYDPGNYYYTDTDSWALCPNTAEGLANSACTGTGWTTDISTEDDRHFHIGNYYNWYAATYDGWQGVIENGDVAFSSVCPAGWRLPKAGTDTDGSFGTHLTSGQKTPDVKSLIGVYELSYSTDSASFIRKAPLYFVPGGAIWTGLSHNIGASAYYWTATTVGGGISPYFAFSKNVMQPSQNTGDWYSANTIRCVMLGSK